MEDEAVAARSDDDEGAGAGAARQEAGEGSASMEDSGGSPRGGPGSGRRGGLGASMVMGGIDPLQWKAETERVAVKLAAHTARTQGGHLSSEWMDHVESLKQYRVAHTMSAMATGADGDGAQETAGRHRAPTVSATALATQLQVMRADIGSYQARIRSQEQLLNRTGGVPAAALNFTALRSVRP
jgi:flagellin-like hook-associated protein FlgL